MFYYYRRRYIQEKPPRSEKMLHRQGPAQKSNIRKKRELVEISLSSPHGFSTTGFPRLRG